MSAWPKVKLGEVLRRRPLDVTVDPGEEYDFAGVFSFGRGVFRRGSRRGSEFSYRQLTRLRTGDFVYPKLMAWEGAFGLVPPKCEGCCVSPEFSVFEVNRAQLAPELLGFYFQIPRAWEEVSGSSTGTNIRRRRLNPVDFLQGEIPLPPLAEQRRIVPRIEELVARVYEARTLRREAAGEAEALLSRATSSRLDEGGWMTCPLGEILAEKPRNGLGPQPEVTVGGRQLLRINAVSSTRTRFVDMSAAKRVQVSDAVAQQFVVRDNDVFIVRYNGDINRVAKSAIYKGQNADGVVYPDKLIRLRPSPARMNPDFLVYALNTRMVRSQIEELGKTTAGNIGVSGADAQSFVVPVPPLADQLRIVSELDTLQVEVNELKRLQAETVAELDALLPAIFDRAFKGEL